MPKTPTEKINLDDVWNGFKMDYLPFVEWKVNSETEEEFIDVIFQQNAPIAYINKWSREQFKIQVSVDDSSYFLSAGKRLFTTIRELCIKTNKLPIDLGCVRILRFGSGFDTNYKIIEPK